MDTQKPATNFITDVEVPKRIISFKTFLTKHLISQLQLFGNVILVACHKNVCPSLQTSACKSVAIRQFFVMGNLMINFDSGVAKVLFLNTICVC